ncbi:MAG: MetQ/NlpA family ABC transporter substrate-binding protein [Coxiellaceae bacterium]|nr:MetQ/NlpA family ABC transporter substrate-binding protein [Coxiellaceae bacterium]
MKVGVMVGPQQEIMKVAAEVARKKYDLDIDVIGFNDYVQPNIALDDGDIQANIFQHVPYLDAQIKSRHLNLMPIAKTFIYPMGFYSKKISNIHQLPNDAVVAMPNDPSNEGRALLLLQKYHLIKLKPGSGLLVNLHDIVSNPKHLQFKLLDAAQLPRVFKDATLVGLTNDFLKAAGLKANQALIREGKDSAYANVIVVRSPEDNKAEFDKLIKVMHSPEVVKETMKMFPDGEAIPAW